MFFDAAIESSTECDVDASRQAQLTAHAGFITAHLEDDLPLWRSFEAGELLVVVNGEIATDGEERWARREAYLSGTEFTIYADEVPPHVVVADDCSLAWMLVQVRVDGYPVSDPAQAFSYRFAWT